MDIGGLIRDLRLVHGWSQGRLATELCKTAGHATVTRDEVKRWESGKRTPTVYWLGHLATTLQVPMSLLEDCVKRRRFLTDAVGATIAPAVAGDLIDQGFTAALRGRAADDEWQAKLDAYGHDYMSQGAAEIQRRLAGDLVVLQQQLDTPHMWSIASRLMTVYGKTYPGSDGTKAVRWYRAAAIAADRSEDLATRVWVRGRAALALGYEGAALPVADMFADQALALSDRPSLGRLNAVMAKAHVAAIRGDEASARLLLDQARRVFDTAGSHDGQESDYAVPEWRMAVFVSLLAARLGDERTAVHAQEIAQRMLPANLPRFATHLDMHRGLMIARAGDRSGGIAHARAALDRLPPVRHSLTLRMLMAEVENGASTAR